MAKKTKKSAENIVAQPAPAAVATPTTTPKLIVAQRKFDRWYVYLKGVKPSENCGCGCKSAKSAIRYMHLVKARLQLCRVQPQMQELNSRLSARANSPPLSPEV